MKTGTQCANRGYTAEVCAHAQVIVSCMLHVNTMDVTCGMTRHATKILSIVDGNVHRTLAREFRLNSGSTPDSIDTGVRDRAYVPGSQHAQLRALFAEGVSIWARPDRCDHNSHSANTDRTNAPTHIRSTVKVERTSHVDNTDIRSDPHTHLRDHTSVGNQHRSHHEELQTSA